MRITVTTPGPTFDRLIAQTDRALRRTNRLVGRDVATAGGKAIRSKAPRMFGRKLGVKVTAKGKLDGCDISFRAKPAGPWAIVETGARPHPIRPRRKRALSFEGRFAAAVAHPGTGGQRAWTKAGVRLQDAVDPVVTDAYDEVLAS